MDEVKKERGKILIEKSLPQFLNLKIIFKNFYDTFKSFYDICFYDFHMFSIYYKYSHIY